MTFNIITWSRNHKPLLINILLYFVGALLIAVVLSYFIFVYKISILNQKISTLDGKLLVYASAEQKASEKEVFDYKKKVDDFSKIISNHRISLNIFTFIEEKTLPDVRFLNFNLSEVKGDISLLGESKNMETLSKQVRIFEANRNYIKSINVLNSQMTQQGTTRFTLNISLNPDIFKDEANKAPVTPL